MQNLSFFVSWSGAVLCFLPAFLNWKLDITGYSENSIPLRYSMLSKSFEYSLVVSIAVCVPLICEQAADSVLTVINKSTGAYAYEHIVLWKWILLIALLVPNLIILNIIYPSEDSMYIPIIFSSRQIVLFHVLFSFLTAYGSEVWTSQITNLCSILFNAGQVLESYSAFVPISSPINPIKYGINVFCTIIVIATSVRWLLLIKNRFNSKQEGLSINEYYCNVHLLAMGIAVGGLWCLSLIYSSTSWAGAPEPLLYMYSYLEIAYTVLLTVWNGRLARWEMAQTRTELETKRMFVRYVSHEIRTPLNTVAMGLQLLRTELFKIRRNETMLDIVQDLSVSCDTAVDILNSLLTYEKLTANILELDSAVISVKKFLSEVVRPFLMQARQAGIELAIVFGGDLLDESVDVNIFGDNSKLSQVVRNLLSNALKFTKRDGHVVVSVSICADPTTTTPFTPAAAAAAFSSVRIHGIDSTPLRNDGSAAARRIRNIDSCDVNLSDGCDPTARSRSGDAHRKTMKWLKVAVIDSGAGISEENQKRLFKEIVQFNPGELQDGKGSGLGLWISSRIMELHGGDLTVFSEGVGHGCTFTLITPVQEMIIQPPQVEHKAFTAPHRPFVPSNLVSVSVDRSGTSSLLGEGGAVTRTSLSSTLHSALGIATYNESESGDVASRSQSHFLLVDDVAMNRKMLNRLLRDRCGTISEAEDGKQALDMVQASLRNSSPSRSIISVVIMDFQMPVMDGPTAVREMRSAGYRGIVIGLTGNALPADIQWFLSHGADRVMIKPCNVEELDAILRGLMIRNQTI